MDIVARVIESYAMSSMGNASTNGTSTGNATTTSSNRTKTSTASSSASSSSAAKGHGGGGATKQTAAQIAYRLYRNTQNNNWEKNIQYAFAAFVGLFCLCYLIEEGRLRLSKKSTRKPNSLYQYPKNLITRISMFSFKIPVIGARVYLPMLFSWLIFAGVVVAAIIADTLDSTLKHQYDLISVAKRSGHISAAMFPMLFFLSMKNSPVGLFIGSSHEKLNIVHRWTGRTLITVVAVHLITYTVYYKQAGKLQQLTEMSNVYGILGFVMLLLIGMTSVAMARRKAYEVFFVLHWAFTITVLAFSWLHIDDTIVWVKAAGGIIGTDLVLRLFRTWTFSSSFTFVSNAKLENINDELVSVTIQRPSHNPLTRWVPGSHAFLNIPAIGVHQRHPFTISSIPEDGFMRFIIKKQKGFTASLHKREVADVHCVVDGSYGSLEMTRFSLYPNVLLVGGGVGITFILPILKSLLIKANAVQSITFIWTTRHLATFQYFEKEVRALYESQEASGSDVVLCIKLIRTGAGNTTLEEKSSSEITASTNSGSSSPQLESSEKKGPSFSAQHVSESVSTMTTEYKRVVMKELIENASSDKDRLAVGVCGPNHLILDARRAVSAQLSNNKDIWLYTEEFEW